MTVFFLSIQSSCIIARKKSNRTEYEQFKTVGFTYDFSNSIGVKNEIAPENLEWPDWLFYLSRQDFHLRVKIQPNICGPDVNNVFHQQYTTTDRQTTKTLKCYMKMLFIRGNLPIFALTNWFDRGFSLYFHTTRKILFDCS